MLSVGNDGRIRGVGWNLVAKSKDDVSSRFQCAGSRLWDAMIRKQAHQAASS